MDNLTTAFGMTFLLLGTIAIARLIWLALSPIEAEPTDAPRALVEPPEGTPVCRQCDQAREFWPRDSAACGQCDQVREFLGRGSEDCYVCGSKA